MNAQIDKPTVLVTGANGQLGNELREISINYSGYHFLFTSHNDLPVENIQRVESFFKKNEIAYCINCAAYTAVDKAESEEEAAFQINATAVGNLAKVCFKNNAKLVHISTDYVYDGSDSKPLKESSPVGPVNVYGASKLKGEELALQNDPSVLIIRTSWVYSSFGNNFVKTMIRLLSEKEEINVINDQQGCPTFAADLADVIMKLVAQIQEGKNFSGIVNYCNSGITTWYDFAVEIRSLINSHCKINPIPSSAYKTAATRPKYSVLDTTKISEWLQSDIPSWKESLKKCVELLRSR
ncbi:MAG: dTDP-4-dehydrorhamnose reductase [Ginsengibacter sp.]|nr:dTDP-4-dehydrorhamnose reductase [Hanamia sp.]